MKKIILSIAVLIGAQYVSNAQVFQLEHDTLIENTEGSTPPGSETYDDYAITMTNYFKNLTTSPLMLSWQLYSREFPDNNWFVYSLCDNQICYYNGQPTIESAVVAQTNPIAVNDKGLFKLQVAVPVSAANGQGVVKARVFNLEQSDTAIFIINKTPVGINTIRVNDNRVSLFPNPGTTDLNVFVNQELNARELAVYNILGSKVATVKVQGEVSTVKTANFATGNYFVKVLGQNGEVITSRKWMKN